MGTEYACRWHSGAELPNCPCKYFVAPGLKGKLENTTAFPHLERVDPGNPMIIWPTVVIRKLLKTLGLLRSPDLVTDPFFGELKFVGSGGSVGIFFLEITGHWECDIDFEPTGRKLKLYFFEADRGPLTRQSKFFKEFERRYVELVERLTPLLQEAHTKATGLDGASLRFTCSAITLPSFSSDRSDDLDNFEWDLYFQYEDGMPTSNVSMKHWEIDEYYSGH